MIYIAIFIIILVMSVLCTIRYFRLNKTIKYEENISNLYITYNNGNALTVTSDDFVDYSFNISISNTSSNSGSYAIYIETNKEINYSIKGNTNIKNSDDILINKSSSLSETDSIGSAYITQNQIHNYKINVSGSNLSGLELKIRVEEVNNEN